MSLSLRVVAQLLCDEEDTRNDAYCRLMTLSLEVRRADITHRWMNVARMSNGRRVQNTRDAGEWKDFRRDRRPRFRRFAKSTFLARRRRRGAHVHRCSSGSLRVTERSGSEIYASPTPISIYTPKSVYTYETRIYGVYTHTRIVNCARSSKYVWLTCAWRSVNGAALRTRPTCRSGWNKLRLTAERDPAEFIVVTEAVWEYMAAVYTVSEKKIAFSFSYLTIATVRAISTFRWFRLERVYV